MWNIPRISVAAVAVALILSGCVPAAPAGTAAPKPTSTPIFANDAEALAAATKAYAAYVKVSDEILAEGGANPDRLRSVAMGKQLETDLAGFKTARSERVHGVGNTTFETVSLQQYSDSTRSGGAEVVTYLCEDVSNVDVRNAEGTSVVSSSRPNRVNYEVTFEQSKDIHDSLLVSKKTLWEDGAC